MHKVIGNAHALELNGVDLLLREPLQQGRTKPTGLMVLFQADPMAVALSYTLLQEAVIQWLDAAHAGDGQLDALLLQNGAGLQGF